MVKWGLSPRSKVCKGKQPYPLKTTGYKFRKIECIYVYIRDECRHRGDYIKIMFKTKTTVNDSVGTIGTEQNLFYFLIS